MGLIAIEGMKFYACHGVLDEEQIIGNEYIVDIWLQTDVSKASEQDTLEDTIDYSYVHSLVKAEMHIKSRLIEHLGKRILDSVLKNCAGICKMTVKVSKLRPPVHGNVDRVSITLDGNNC